MNRDLDIIYVDIQTSKAYYRYSRDDFLPVSAIRRATVDATELCQMTRPEDIIKYKRVEAREDSSDD